MSDILDTIDAALAGTCPCGAELGPDSPSLDWCSPACQQRWFERQAHGGERMADMVEAAEAAMATIAEGQRRYFTPVIVAHEQAMRAAIRAALTTPIADPRTILHGITVM